MKKIIPAICFCMIAIISTAQTSSLQQLLPDYYALKNALVKDDANTASTAAAKLLRDTKSVDSKTLNASEQQTFISVKDKMIYNSDHISEVNDIDHQREHFEALSNAMSMLVQSVNISEQPVYVDYCLMKKAYWLSNEKQVQNPYYGKEMMDCGKVTKTVMPGKEHSMQTDNMDMNNSISMNDTMPMKNMNHDMRNVQMNDSSINTNEMDMNMPMNNMSHSFSLNLPMSRNGSGTGWSPDAAPMYGQMYHSKK